MTSGSGLDSSEYQHAPFNHGVPSIRLVHVLPDLSADRLICCKISYHALPVTASEYSNDGKGKGIRTYSTYENLYPYICLSYVWGDVKDKTAIRINGRIAHVGKNLFGFLHHARQTLFSTHFWIDALCIDQSNTAEKNQQVQQMGRVYSLAQTVLIWLGDDVEIENLLCLANEANGELNAPLIYATLERKPQFWYSRALLDFDTTAEMSHDQAQCPDEASLDFIESESEVDILNDLPGSCGKIEILFQKLSENEYWSRAWVTQEVLLAKHVVVAVGFEAHGLLSLARKFRTAIAYSRDTLFEKLIDIRIAHKNWSYVDQRTWLVHGDTGLEDWSIVNLLHRFRHKKCTIRRDRIYSLLALSKEGRMIQVDYDLAEDEVMRQVLSIRANSICLCSTAIVAHALAPWDFEAMKDHEEDSHFAELDMYACTLNSTACPFCAHWVPFSWTRKKGLVFCFETACPDTPGHFFWEQSDTIVASNEAEQEGNIYLQLRKNNTSRLLCENGLGLCITQSDQVHMFKLRFTFRTFIEALLDDMGTSDLGLNACRNLWPTDSSRKTTGESTLRILA